MSLRVAVNGLRSSLTQSRPQDRSADASQHFPQAIRRWGNSLAVRLPADCLRQAGLQEGDQIDIVVEPDGRLSLVSLPRFQGQCLESCFYTDPMKTNDHNECPFYASPLQR